MSTTVALVGIGLLAGLTGAPAAADCWKGVPTEVLEGLHIVPPDRVPLGGRCVSHLKADFDGDSLADHALLLAESDGHGDSQLVVASKHAVWTLSLVRGWGVGRGPAKLQRAAPGKYVRPGGILEALEPDEVPQLISRHPGVLAGGQAFFWDRDHWISVRTSNVGVAR